MPPEPRPPTAPVGNRRWKIFATLLAVGTVSYMDRSSLSVGMPMIAKEFDLSPQMQGLVISMFFWSYALFLVPGGWLADRVGPRRVLTVVLTLWAVTQVGTGLVTGLATLVVLRLLLGMFEAPYYPSAAQLSAAWLPSRDRGRGAALMDSASALGGAVGGLVVGSLITATDSWRSAFVIVGAVTLLAGAAAHRMVRDRPAEHPGASAEEVAYIEHQLALEDDRAGDAEGPDMNPVDFLRFPTFWFMGVGFFAGNVLFYGLLTYGPLYLSQAQGLDIAELTWATTLIYGCGFVGENVAGWVSQLWLGRGARPDTVMRTLTGLSGAVSTLAILTLAFVPGKTLAIVLLSVTLFFLRILGLYWTLPATLAGRRRAGVLGGMMNVFSNVGGILSPLVIGLLVGLTGSYFVGLLFFAAAGLLYLVCSVNIHWGERLVPRRAPHFQEVGPR